MKINEAAEKIYLNIDGDGIHYYTEGTPTEREYVEYVLADVFVEKAYEYLNKTCRRFILTEMDIEDFKNYMKG